MRLLLLLALLIGTATQVEAQKKKGKAKTSAKGKKGKKSKKLKTGGIADFDELVCYDDGPCTFSIHKGDTLVYEVNQAGRQYYMMVIPNKFDDAAVADFNWGTTDLDRKGGHVVINGQGLKNSKRYVTMVQTGEQKLNDASFLWFCGDNFSEISKNRQTSVVLDNGAAETFTSPADGDAVSLNINYKGTPIELEGFLVQNKTEGSVGRKYFWVMNITTNLLFFKMDTGNMTMTLKEVREKKGK
jgi:hypothetical protein